MDSRNNSAKIVERKITRPNVKILYPEVQGLKNKVAQARINELIRQQVYGLIKKQTQEQSQMGTKPHEVVGGYKIEVNKKGVLSIYFDNYTYYEHAAHGLTIVSSITADLNTGRVYQLKDLFVPGSDYVARINAAIKQQIQEKDIPLINDFNSISPDQQYYLTDNTLVIYFQLYQYTPYYYGIPQFPIPFAELSDIVNENGAIGKLMG